MADFVLRKGERNFRRWLFIILSTLFIISLIFLDMRDLHVQFSGQLVFIIIGLTCTVYIINFIIGSKTVRKVLAPKKVALLLLWILLPPFALAMVGLWCNTEILVPIIISYFSGGLLGAIFGATRHMPVESP